MNEKHGKSFAEFMKFALVGVSNVLVSESIYALLCFVKMHYLPASFIGFSVSVLNAYFWNNKFVFKEQDDKEKRVWWKVLGKTYLAYLWSCLASGLLLVFWMELIKVDRWMVPFGLWFAGHGFSKIDAEFLGNLLAAFFNIIITFPVNFLLNKYWAFRQKKKKAKGENNDTD